MNFKYVQKHRILIMSMIKRINLRLIDDFIKNELTKLIIIKIPLKNHVKKMLCLMTSLNKFDLILKIS